MLTDARPQLVEILSRQPLFRGLTEEELHFIAQGCREIRAQKNEILFQKGDVAEGMHVLVMGQVKLSLPSPQGSEKVVHMFESASTFGEAVAFLDKPYPVTAQATQDSLLLLVSKRTLLETLDANPLLCRKMLASLSTRLHELLDDMETCTLRTSSQRVICFLSNLAPPTQPDQYEILLPASKQTIASQLNLAPETFSRVLGHLAGAGLIQVKGRSITVLDAIKLRNFTG
ncbi:MAG: Crp/Fnr family transcriptional regulator [Thiobacillus sp.]|nr:Crp/Fnr family transcriptional regulator [Thiobacillus sp.]